MNNDDRIKLAEAMGWVHTRCELVDAGQAIGWESPDKKLFRRTNELPDPFTDANDDYAVLEWFRTHYTGRKYEEVFGDELLLSEWGIPAYEIGDYARAALKVLDNE